MKRAEIIEKMNKLNGGPTISDKDKTDYIKRLKTPYIKKGIKKTFFDQYDRGSGSELAGKLWSSISSSRFAFEMYSWLAELSSVIDIEFELKLVGVTTRGVPNMDVYIELKDKIIFIENKFTESYEQIIDCSTLPGAYWKEKGDKEALTTDKPPKPIGSLLIQRYHKDQEALDEFLLFINTFEERLNKELDDTTPKIWMEYSQEIKHLYGIYFYLKKHRELHGKEVDFYNVYYYLEDPTNAVLEQFFVEGEKMMNKLLKKYNISFKYKALKAQDVIKEMDDEAEAFCQNNKVKNILKDKFLVI